MAKILLVEDDNNLREIFEMRLQAEGYQTTTASNGEDALVTAMKEKPDLIVADIMMPKLSGFEMLETLRAAPEMKNIKVIMMTALGQAEDQARGEKLGVVKYLVKSQVTLEDFVRVIREVLQPDKSSAGVTADGSSESDKADHSSTNNKKESEKFMPDDTTPNNPSAPAPGGSDSGADSNPISSPAPGGDSGSGGQLTSDQESGLVEDQKNDFLAGTPAPAPDDSGGAATGGDSGSDNGLPVTPPPDAPAGDDAASSDDQPAATPPSV